jgi:spore coat protein A
MPNRRQFVKGGVAVGAVAAIGGPKLLTGTAEAATIDPATIPKYVTPLFIMPAMPRQTSSAARDEYSIAARRFNQQVLPSGFPSTPAFGFVSTTSQMTAHTPAWTIEAKVNKQTRVTWRNQLVDGNNRFLSSLTTVDPTLHWANPPGGVNGRDSEPVFSSTPPPYTGPIPHTIHLHGERAFEESDGYAESWFLPAASNIPAGYARVGSFYDQFKAEAQQRWGVNWPAGGAIFVYPNDQPAGACWYHDHALGMTRNNVYSGLVGMYLLRGGDRDLPAGVLPGPAPQNGDPANKKYFEIPLVFQDKRFNTNGSLFFPASRADSPDQAVDPPYSPFNDVPPYWNPTFQGDTIAVNGNTWPFLNVEQRRYRFRCLAAANFRSWVLRIVSNPTTRPATSALPIWVIGSDVGFLPRPQMVQTLPMFTAERYDIIVDFTSVPVGTNLFLINDQPANIADPNTTGQMMQFRVVARTSPDTSTPPANLQLPGFPDPGPNQFTRKLSAQSVNSTTRTIRGTTTPAQSRFALGTINSSGVNTPRRWFDPLTENPAFNRTETWELHNFTAGAHSIHIHLIQFAVVNRQNISTGAVSAPMPHETGPKDVVFTPGVTADAPGGQITRVKMKFDRRSRYMWHCHLIDHEDHEMMRPFVVS